MIYPDNFERKIGFEGIREALLAECLSTPGSRRVGEMAFSSDIGLITRQVDATAEMLAIVTSDEPLPLSPLPDLEAVLAALKIPGAIVAVDDLVNLRRLFQTAKDVAEYFTSRRDEGKSPFPTLDLLMAELRDLPEVRRLIDSVIDRYGNVKDSASPRLAEIRHGLRALQSSMATVMRRVLAKAVAEGVVEADTSPAVRDGRLVIPVSPANKRRLSGIVHDESASGKTVFIEPAEVVEAGNRLRELQLEEQREIARIIAETVAAMRPKAVEMEGLYDDLGHLDFIRAKAIFSNRVGGIKPHIANPKKAEEMEWFHACHPMLRLSLERQGKEIVPLDIRLTPENRILVISGPNAGGKSVTLKTVGCLQYMLQCGMLPPVYENSRFLIFRDIMVDIGDDQSLENDLSTYSSHLRNMKFCLQNGSAKSLLLIDEFGAGTEPQIGGAIAQAILSQFNNLGMWGIITTHYQNLKHFAEETPGLVNGSMLYDRNRMMPLFRLSIGNPGSSFALEIARKTGLPQQIIDSARQIVGSDYVNLDKYLLDIARDKRYWEQKRLSIKRKEKDLDAVIERYTDDAEALRRSRREILDQARSEASRILDSSNAAIERTISEIRAHQAEKEATKTLRANLENLKKANNLTPSEPEKLRKAPKKKKSKTEHQQPKSLSKPLAVGDTVKIKGQTSPGRILSIDSNKAVVAFGMLKTTVEINRLEPSNEKIKSGAEKKSSFLSSSTVDEMRNRQLSFKQDIDIRGMRVEEALRAATYFIDEAVQFGIARVRILHGTGTGALRQSLQEYLRTRPEVRSFHDEDVRLGGAGITVIELP